MEFMLDTLNIEEIRKWAEVLPPCGGDLKPNDCEERR